MFLIPFFNDSYPFIGMNPGPLNGVAGNDTIRNRVQLNHDAYDVYVNERYLGKKTLLVQGESIHDVDDFLRSHGLTQFTSSLDGDHYNIQAERDHEQDIVNHMEVYLSNR